MVHNNNLIYKELKSKIPALRTAIKELGGKYIKIEVNNSTVSLFYKDGPSTDQTKKTFNSVLDVVLSELQNKYSIYHINKEYFLLDIDREFSKFVQIYIDNTGDPTFNINSRSISNNERIKIKNSPKSKRVKREAKPTGKYRYGSFLRPVFIGFKLSVPFNIIEPEEIDRDVSKNRLPHDIILTNERIPESELHAYELTDMDKIKTINKMYKYIDSLDIKENKKINLKRLFNSGKIKNEFDISELLNR